MSLERLTAALADRYTIERELGAGGMATVYLAQDLKHERQVAIKVLREDLAASLGAGRFLREIKIAAQLQHPHILPLLDSGEADGFLYFVMPYIKGQSLRERLAREGELPVHEAVRLITEVVDALVEAHEHGVVHRDIKPDNVMLSGRHALVTDFGVAKAISEATGRNTVTTLGVAIGTPTYMSPEQAAADPHVDHRSDIYSVGVMAYEMLSGRPPFTGSTPQQVLAAHVTEAPDSVAKRRPAISPALEAVVMRCLAKRPADRFQSAAELHAALEPLATPSTGITPTQTRPIAAAPSSGAARGGSRRWGLIAAVVVIAIGGWFLATRTGGAAKLRSIAVLPTDIGSDTAHAYLADGLSSDLTTKLSKIPGLSVRAYSPLSVMRGRTVREAGKELGVGAILTVRMARSGAQLRATASLVNAANDDLLWSEVVEASDQDQFALQDKLVTAIAGALNLSLSPATITAVRARGTRSNEAHELVQHSRFEADQFTATSWRSAVSLAEAAIALDSTYADAWAALANAWNVAADDFVSSAATAGPPRRRAFERALALDPTLADAHAQMGTWLVAHGYDWAAGQKELEQALGLDSANVSAGLAYSFLLRLHLHLPDSAKAVIQRAERLNPLSFVLWDGGFLSLVDFTKLSPDSARAICTRAARIQERLAAKCEALRSRAANDRRGEAAAWRRYYGPAPSGRDLADLAYHLVISGDTSGARDALRQALVRANTEYVREDYIADDFLMLGDQERAIQWWVKGAASNVEGLNNLAVDSLYAPIRSDPRIQAIIQRLKVR